MTDKHDPDQDPPELRVLKFDEKAVLYRKPQMLLTERQILLRIRPHDWLVQGIIEKGYLYALTGATSSGKTGVALAIAYRMGNADLAPYLGPHAVERGRCLFLAGENPLDVYRRAQGMRLHHGLKVDTNIRFVEGVMSMADHKDAVRQALEEDGQVDLIVVDTLAAFYGTLGKEENDNTSMGNFARLLREWTKMPGNPAVLVLCHPAKFVTSNENDQMIPRGGSAFLAEIDGNLILVSRGNLDERTCDLHHTSKLRGPGFDPIPFNLMSFTHEKFNDTKGRASWTVIAVPITSEQEAEQDEKTRNIKREIIEAMTFAKRPMQVSELVALTGKSQATVYRTVKFLRDKGKIEEDDMNGGWIMRKTRENVREPENGGSKKRREKA